MHTSLELRILRTDVGCHVYQGRVMQMFVGFGGIGYSVGDFVEVLLWAAAF